MKTANAMVVDAEGNKIDIVRVHFKMVDGVETQEIIGYTLNKGERLVFEDFAIALGMTKPKQQRNGKWKETATAEEIAATKPEPELPSELEKLAVEFSEALAAQQDMFLLGITELTLLATGGI